MPKNPSRIAPESLKMELKWLIGRFDYEVASNKSKDPSKIHSKCPKMGLKWLIGRLDHEIAWNKYKDPSKIPLRCPKMGLEWLIGRLDYEVTSNKSKDRSKIHPKWPKMPKNGTQVADWLTRLWSSMEQVQKSLQNPSKICLKCPKMELKWLIGRLDHDISWNKS